VRSADTIVADGYRVGCEGDVRAATLIIWMHAVSARKGNHRVLGSVRLRYATAMRNIKEGL